MTPLFITGTGTDVGKTLVSAIVTEALHADYWKPVQAGHAGGTDSLWVEKMITNKNSVVHPELYRLKMPASPHLAALAENIGITIKEIIAHIPQTKNQLIIEGAGGLMVPLNEEELILTLIKKMKARVIIVSRNYLGSINHSLLTATVLRKEKLNVAGWIFTDEYKNYEEEIAQWSGYPVIARIKHLPLISKETIQAEAFRIRSSLKAIL